MGVLSRAPTSVSGFHPTRLAHSRTRQTTLPVKGRVVQRRSVSWIGSAVSDCGSLTYFAPRALSSALAATSSISPAGQPAAAVWNRRTASSFLFFASASSPAIEVHLTHEVGRALGGREGLRQGQLAQIEAHDGRGPARHVVIGRGLLQRVRCVQAAVGNLEPEPEVGRFEGSIFTACWKSSRALARLPEKR